MSGRVTFDKVEEPTNFKLPRQKVMILLDQAVARKLWAAMHKKFTPLGGRMEWICQGCRGASRLNRPAIKHAPGCPVAELGKRL